MGLDIDKMCIHNGCKYTHSVRCCDAFKSAEKSIALLTAKEIIRELLNAQGPMDLEAARSRARSFVGRG